MRTSYTVEQANRTLPLVSRIVDDIVTLYPRWRDRVSEIEIRAGGATVDDPDPRTVELEREAQEIAAEIDGCIREIRDLGIEYRLPLDAGLVDFPGEREGRRIFLCWRLGETAVAHWHETDAGYAGRRPIEDEISDVDTIHPERR
ncbi:MAG TPA: DUF2203 domain-containing protein [Gemmatimonadaceae bacterium]|nr:DUF2203 domain-containing protein [Gemmatimonadaceae bacterium]